MTLTRLPRQIRIVAKIIQICCVLLTFWITLEKDPPPLFTSLSSFEKEETYSGIIEVVVQDIVTILSCTTWVCDTDVVFVVVV